VIEANNLQLLLFGMGERAEESLGIDLV